jgi:hypothetical protein
MNKEMAVGTKVHYQGHNLAISPCDGVIESIHPSWGKPGDEDYEPEWAIVRVTKKGEKWPYHDNTFAPELSELEWAA